ncbi:hypothetical protein BaRGS_00001754 [Batillaria attramentaria]|uniref:Uncharacterized protein n=1 Tax=Batillaria attramentaria TaxID=370345 RepID=A0ABD0M571_9CAEN
MDDGARAYGPARVFSLHARAKSRATRKIRKNTPDRMKTMLDDESQSWLAGTGHDHQTSNARGAGWWGVWKICLPERPGGQKAQDESRGIRRSPAESPCF